MCPTFPSSSSISPIIANARNINYQRTPYYPTPAMSIEIPVNQ